MPPEDRVSLIIGMLIGVIDRGGDLRVEAPDTNESKELMKFCCKLTVQQRIAMREQKILMARENATHSVLHIFFIVKGCYYVG